MPQCHDSWKAVALLLCMDMTCTERDTAWAMSEENVQLVRRMYESQSGEEFFEFLDPQVVWTNYASAPETRPYIGHDGVREWVKGFRTHIGDFQFEVSEVLDAGGDQVCHRPPHYRDWDHERHPG